MPSKDLLSGSRHRRSSHAKDEFTSVTVRKDDPNEKAGIRLESDETGRVKIANIAKNGLFAQSEVEIGDIVLSINGKRLAKGEGPEALIEVIARAKSKVTVVVKKTTMAPRVPEKAKKDFSMTEDNNVERIDTYYEGQSKHKDDGSLAFAKASEKAAKKKLVTSTTISANKEDQTDGEIDESAGIELVVQNKRLYVSTVSKHSIFLSTDLEVGHRVLSINDCNFREFADAEYATTIVEKANNTVTIVIDKDDGGFAPADDEPRRSRTKPSRTKSGSSRGSRTGTKKGKAIAGKDPDRLTESEHQPRQSRTKPPRTKSDSSRSSRTGSKKDKSSLKRLPKGKSSLSISSDLDSTDSLSDGEDSFGGEEEFEMLLPLEQSRYREILISAPKSFSQQEVGITFDQKKNKYLAIDKIAKDSIFKKTSLERGDIVLEINGIDFRQTPDKLKALKASIKTKETVTLLVWKEKEQTYTSQAFDLDASSTNLEWE